MTILDLVRRLSETSRPVKVQFHVEDAVVFCLVELDEPAAFVRRSTSLSNLEREPSPDAWLDWWIADSVSKVVARADSVPMKYVLAQDYNQYAAWLLSTKTPGFHAIYLDGQPLKGDRIAQGCLIKLDNWDLNDGYTLSFRRALMDCATPEDWTREDITKGITEIRT